LENAVGCRLAKTALYEQFARVGKALASGKRLELLDLLAQGERTVEALARASDLGVTTASAHLQTLKASNLVSTRREGTKIYYHLAGEDVAGLFAALRTVADTHLPDVSAAASAYLGPGSEQVTCEELLKRVQSGKATIIDVRPPVEFAAGHILGALSIPLEELAERLDELPADVTIVAYCRGAYCVLADDAVRLLTEHGRRAARLTDGMLEWRLANLPIETAA
jgi:rhodanese-related sulfurtransferase/DNA-binding transcriptional ArsR family regulator